MKYLKALFDFYINSSIHVALAVYALAWISLIEFGLDYDGTSLYIIFYATIAAYNFVKYFGLFRFHYRRFTRAFKWILGLSLLAIAATVYYLLYLRSNAIILIGILGLITGFYAMPFVPKKLVTKGQRSLRQVRGLKVYVIAFVWASTTVLLPVLNSALSIDINVLIAFVQRFLIVLVLMLPFEIRDLKYDSLKLSTIPQQIGVKNTKRLGYVLLGLFFGLEFLKPESPYIFIISYGLMAILTLIFLRNATIGQNSYYSGFWVEGLPLIWLCFLIVFG